MAILGLGRGRRVSRRPRAALQPLERLEERIVLDAVLDLFKWRGGVDHNWSNPHNWLLNGGPNNGGTFPAGINDVAIFNQESNVPCTVNTTISELGRVW